ncbi:MAG: N-acetyl-1-D-myo-inositol-2-amino-2-deoxy-alpha-D-glucopyranoside deacetylase [Propionibacteriaceae bacterium]|nr:N-acetyl-1-D-myo-inositol-2-amino-2-deoxy-alpha-D-glucopyranoside deacetylase [Propionibacteriaceae bacterium]
MNAQQRLVMVHAHPDDESSQSSATLSRYVAEGAGVTLVTCTLGERGEILVPDWEHFSPTELGEHRLQELATALGIMGVTDHVWLGGPGTYQDTGMTTDERGRVLPAPDAPDSSFWKADLLAATNHLVEVIRSRRPQVLSSYDPNGNYGHPDHIQAHRITMYAAQLAAIHSHRPDLGEPWQVSRILWNTINPAMWEEAGRLAKERGIDLFGESDDEAGPRRPGISEVAAVIPYGDYLQQCTDALLAHRSQVNPDQDFWQFFSIMRGLPSAGEAYILAAGQPFPHTDALPDDLFAGLDLSV